MAGGRKSSSHAVEQTQSGWEQQSQPPQRYEQRQQPPSDSPGTEDYEVLHTHKVRRGKLLTSVLVLWEAGDYGIRHWSRNNYFAMACF